MWNKTKSWFKNSATILWARIQVFTGLVAASLMALASDPNVSSAIQSALQPKFIPYYVIVVGPHNRNCPPAHSREGRNR